MPSTALAIQCILPQFLHTKLYFQLFSFEMFALGFMKKKMGLVSTLLGIIGFVIGIPAGLFLGFFFFIYSKPKDIAKPLDGRLEQLDSSLILELLPHLPMWAKNPDYERVEWLNKFIANMWPYLDKAICGVIRSISKPTFEKYIGKFQIRSSDFETLSLGTLPPTLQGIKIYETNENELVIEPAVRWAGNPNITLAMKLLFLSITVQVEEIPGVEVFLQHLPCASWQIMDLQISLEPRIVLKPLVPPFPCFANITEILREKLAILYHWPRALEVPILDGSVGAMKKRVGILHVKVVRAIKLVKMDFLGTSDPYVKLKLSGERLPAKKTSVEMKNLKPEWNEDFKLIVKDPQSQKLELRVYDWEKIGKHAKLGMQVVPLESLVPHETKNLTLDLHQNVNPSDPQNKKWRGKVVLEMTFNHFKEENDDPTGLGGLLLLRVIGAPGVEGRHHTNPYALVLFKGERKKTKMIKKTRDPSWNEEFQFMLEEAPVNESIHIEESLGFVDINLGDVVYNSRINDKYDLINSRNGVIHIEMEWKVT
ncbi:Synaptotagmin, SMP domain [Dillenia turbinata]|uniref:Synaptotagmin, SMP domain n=1 Tax=Dillenia turbinata TaxID=194707 RepID=A0AAN8W6N1_9MAGN